MESLERVRRQLEGLDDLRTIVKTMKALSAASIRQFEQAVTALSEYSRSINTGLYAVLTDGESRPASQGTRASHVSAAVVFGSDHGLCGRFNEEVAEHALDHMKSHSVDPKDRVLLAVGSRVAAHLGNDAQALDDILLVPSSAAHIGDTVQKILLKVEEWTERLGVGEVHLFYNRHFRGKGYQPTELRLFPIDLAHIRELQGERWPGRSLPTFTIDRGVLLSRLLRQYLFVSIFRACAESLASEHASRLSAMQAAERNLDERFEEVTMLFRRARQTAITSELLDIVSGFEALAGR